MDREEQYDFVNGGFAQMQKAKTMSKEEVRIDKLERKCDLLAQGLASWSDLLAEAFLDLAKTSPQKHEEALNKARTKCLLLVDRLAEEVERIDDD